MNKTWQTAAQRGCDAPPLCSEAVCSWSKEKATVGLAFKGTASTWSSTAWFGDVVLLLLKPPGARQSRGRKTCLLGFLGSELKSVSVLCFPDASTRAGEQQAN